MHIPGPIIGACVGLVLLFTVLLAQMLSGASKAHQAMRSLWKALAAAAPSSPLERRSGLRNDHLQAIRSRCSQLQEPMRAWWSRIEENLEKYVAPDGREGWFLAVSPRDVLREETVSERFYHSSFYQAVPGILTGLGLLSTFVAILLALTGLHVSVANNTETVTGIRELIDGLSGKFLSSIVGLLLSIIFLITERKWCERRLANDYEELLDATSHLIPTISPVRIHLDIQNLAARHAVLLEGISTELIRLREMVSVANAAVPEMARALATDVELFSDKLGELSEGLDRSLQRLR